MDGYYNGSGRRLDEQAARRCACHQNAIQILRWVRVFAASWFRVVVLYHKNQLACVASDRRASHANGVRRRRGARESVSGSPRGKPLG
jgi:hypothetical protein